MVKYEMTGMCKDCPYVEIEECNGTINKNVLDILDSNSINICQHGNMCRRVYLTALEKKEEMKPIDGVWIVTKEVSIGALFGTEKYNKKIIGVYNTNELAEEFCKDICVCLDSNGRVTKARLVRAFDNKYEYAPENESDPARILYSIIFRMLRTSR